MRVRFRYYYVTIETSLPPLPRHILLEVGSLDFLPPQTVQGSFPSVHPSRTQFRVSVP